MEKQKIINKQWGEFALNDEPRNYWGKYFGLTEKTKENKIKWQKKKKLITTKNGGIIIAWQWEAIR